MRVFSGGESTGVSFSVSRVSGGSGGGGAGERRVRRIVEESWGCWKRRDNLGSSVRRRGTNF